MKMEGKCLLNERLLGRAETRRHRVDFIPKSFPHRTWPVSAAGISGDSSILETGPPSKFFLGSWRKVRVSS